MKRVFAALAILGAVGLVAACANQTRRAAPSTAAPTYTAPAPAAPAASCGADTGASCGGAGRA